MKYSRQNGNTFVVIIVIILVIWGVASCTKSCSNPTESNKQNPANSSSKTALPLPPARLSPPNLAGAPFEALTKAQAWMKGFEEDVAKSIVLAGSRIQAGAVPDTELASLEARLTYNKQIIAATNGLTALLLQQEQKMADQIKEVEKKINEPGLDGLLKQQYADVSAGAKKSLEAYLTCRANVDILAKKVDSTLGSVDQWKQFYASTVGITGAETARNRLGDMITKASAEWAR